MVWQIATAPLLRHLPGMHLPTLLAVDILSEASPINIGLGIVIVGVVVAFIRSQTTTEARVETQRQDLSAETGARKEADETESKTRKEEVQAIREEVRRLAEHVERSKDASTKRHDDHAHRLGLMETREARQDERTRGLENQIGRLTSTVEAFDGKLDRAMNRDDHPRRRREDKEVA